MNNEQILAVAKKKQELKTKQENVIQQNFERFLSDLSNLLDKGIQIDDVLLLRETIEQFGSKADTLIRSVAVATKNIDAIDIPENITFKTVMDDRLLDRLEKADINDAELLQKLYDLDQTILLLKSTLETTKKERQGKRPQDYTPVRIVEGTDDNLRFLSGFQFGGSGGGTVGGATEAKQNEIIAAIEGISGSVSYRTEIRTVGTLTYIGKAVLGSATSSAVWQIKRLDTTSGLSKLWADGNDNFDNIFDNRASLSYS